MIKTSKIIVCLHGLGASSDSFNDLKNAKSLKEYEFITPDCPGHAKALHDDYHGDPLVFSAKKISSLIENLGQNVILVGHSMGGALAMLIARNIPDKISTLVSIEGNLIAEDCGLISRKIAAADNMDEIIKLRHGLIQSAEKSNNRGWELWAKDVSHINPKTLKDYASSLVKFSDSGELIKIFQSFNKSKSYIYGDGYINHGVLNRLGAIPSYHVKKGDHFVMQDDPLYCADIISETINPI